MSIRGERSLPRDDRIPSGLLLFRMRFATQRNCLAMLRRWRYPEGFRCPRCGGDRAWWIESRGLHQCRRCRRQTSLTAGTMFHGTRKPLSTWFLAMFLFVSSKRAISATELATQVGITLPTAWTWLHKMRVAMEDRQRSLLEGLVEVDESYMGGVEEGRGGRSLKKKACVAGAVEMPEKVRGLGRVRLAHLENAGATELEDFVTSQISPRASIRTDAWRGYRRLGELGFRHVAVNVKRSGLKAHQLLPGTHRVFSLVDRLLLGTYQGAVSRRHLQKYLSEYEFRFNRRRSKSRGLLFQRLLSAAVLDRAITYPELTREKGKGWPVQRWVA